MTKQKVNTADVKLFLLQNWCAFAKAKKRNIEANVTFRIDLKLGLHSKFSNRMATVKVPEQKVS